MNEGNDDDFPPALKDLIEHPICAMNDEFSKVERVFFRHNSTTIGELAQGASRLSRFPNQCLGITRRIALDVGRLPLKPVPSWFRPPYSPSHFAMRLSISS